jgi:hypothetical protein
MNLTSQELKAKFPNAKIFFEAFNQSDYGKRAWDDALDYFLSDKEDDRDMAARVLDDDMIRWAMSFVDNESDIDTREAIVLASDYTLELTLDVKQGLIGRAQNS